jgi:hypothetical protein
MIRNSRVVRDDAVGEQSSRASIRPLLLQARQIDDKNILMEGNSIKGLTNLGEQLQGETVKL